MAPQDVEQNAAVGKRLPLESMNDPGPEAAKPLASYPRIANIAFTAETIIERLITQHASWNFIPVAPAQG
jgi:acyl-CoA reductase-like NAD-dependent aldehyde dehydrogenase